MISLGSTAIEGMFGRVQTKAAAIGVGAFGQQQHPFVQSMGTRVKHSLKLMQFKPTTPSQKEQDAHSGTVSLAVTE